MHRRLRTLLRALREECPTAMCYPVQVRCLRGPRRHFGHSNLRDDERSFLIVLFDRYIDSEERERDVTLEEKRDTLMHEWAHVMAWTSEHHTLTDHDAAWGVAYSKVYAAVVGD